jgi:hypothetical protein
MFKQIITDNIIDTDTDIDEDLIEKQKSYQNIISYLKNSINNPKQIIEDYQKYASWSIKDTMLTDAISYLNKNGLKVDVLLDLASGRGNDLNRWIKNSIPRVIGIELDHEQYLESIKRLKSNNRARNKINVSYVEGSVTSKKLVYDTLVKYTRKDKVNLIVCNFALNYFFKDLETIDEFFDSISSRLNKGGLFIGTAADGDVIKYLLDLFSPETIDNVFYSINYTNGSGSVNKGYEFSLKTPYFDTGLKKFTEYFIFKKELIKIALKRNLKPIQITKDIPAICNFDNRPADYKHGSHILPLFFSFSFVKI